MPRVRKVPLVYGPKRIIYNNDGPEVVRSVFCGECGKLTRASTIQIGKARADREEISRIEKNAFACDNSEGHKFGKKYLWPVDDWIIPRT